MNVLVGIYSRFASWNIPEQYVDRLRAAFPEHVFFFAQSDDDARVHMADVDAAFMSEVRPHHLAASTRLRWVHSPSAGIGGMLFPEMIASPVVLTNSRGMSGDAIAEHVVGVVLALFRKLPLAVRAQAEHRWAQDELSEAPSMRFISKARVLIVGLGGIGAACAWRLAALGAHVTGIRRRVDQPVPRGVSAVLPTAKLGDALPEADVVIIAAPQTGETKQILGAGELGRMRSGAIVVNVSRGKLVDEAALARALESGTLGGAALDVFEHEPLDASSPLWDHPNVLITPHMSWYRPDHWEAATDLFAENLRRFAEGRPLLNVVDKAAGY